MTMVGAPSAGHSYTLSAASTTGIVRVQQSLTAARQSMASIYAAEDRAQNQALELKRAQMTALREQNSKLQEQLKANNDAAKKMRADEKALEDSLKLQIDALEKTIQSVQETTRIYADINVQAINQLQLTNSALTQKANACCAESRHTIAGKLGIRCAHTRQQ
jgi:hypothetical protein